MQSRRFALRFLSISSVAALLIVVTSCIVYLWYYKPTSLNEIEVRFNLSNGGLNFDVVGAPYFNSSVVARAEGDFDGNHAPAVAALSDGSLIAAWYQFDGPDELDGAKIKLATRKPGPNSEWTPLPRLRDKESGRRANPVLYAENDLLWLFSAVVPFGWDLSSIEVQTSRNGGLNWSPPEKIRGPFGTNVRHPPVRVEDGTLVLPAYDDFLDRALFYRQIGGEDWKLSAILSPRLAQPSVVQLGDGSLLTIMRCKSRRNHLVSKSADGGRTWSTPINSRLPCPNTPAVFLRLLSGKLLLVYNNDSNRDLHSMLSVVLSDDDGESWSIPRVIAQGPHVTYPAVIETAGGCIHLLFSDKKRTIRHVEFNEAWIISPTKRRKPSRL